MRDEIVARMIGSLERIRSRPGGWTTQKPEPDRTHLPEMRVHCQRSHVAASAQELRLEVPRDPEYVAFQGAWRKRLDGQSRLK